MIDFLWYPIPLCLPLISFTILKTCQLVFFIFFHYISIHNIFVCIRRCWHIFIFYFISDFYWICLWQSCYSGRAVTSSPHYLNEYLNYKFKLIVYYITKLKCLHIINFSEWTCFFICFLFCLLWINKMYVSLA